MANYYEFLQFIIYVRNNDIIINILKFIKLVINY